MLTLTEWQQTLKPREAYIYNCSLTDGSDGWLPYTIGVNRIFIRYKHCSLTSVQIGSHENLVFCAVNSATDSNRRPSGKNRSSIIETLKQKEIYNNYGYDDYFEQLPKYKFVISPEGNGIDCHRHYEALMAGSIPIVEHNDGIKEQYAGCPILYTDDYSEITAAYLEQKYKEMCEQKWDFSRLFLNFYDEETKNQIKIQGNFWAASLNPQLKWYDDVNLNL
jgi:hypothetical protein